MQFIVNRLILLKLLYITQVTAVTLYYYTCYL